jgi:hypothetical protein
VGRSDGEANKNGRVQGVNCRNKANEQQSSLHRNTSVSVERVNNVNVERIFACYRKLEIKRLQAD